MKIEFYHTFQIPEKGINVIGQWNHYPVKDLLAKHLNVQGEVVLDVACRDGWYSLLFEQLGALGVTAIDIEDREARRWIFEKLNSKVAFNKANVYILVEPEHSQIADVVFTGDLLCHLYYPLRALEGMHNVCRKRCYFVCDVWPYTEVVTADYPNKWSAADMVRLFRLAQFTQITELASFKLDSAYWRSKGCLPTRSLVLYRCERNPDFVPPPPMDFTVDGCPNSIPELVVDVQE